MPTNQLDDRVQAIKQLLEMFKVERIIYLLVTILSLIILLICAVFLLKDKQIEAVVGLFTASGGVAFTCGRLLKMWSDAMNLLTDIRNENEG